ncbi:response regulator transcription factor [Paenibacillus sp. P96]|uniref:Response regulator transcription factor n=1 Tax=Paenibacillus zeirhizosphaerae TaxID=2987519 RepID=A0ABT9FQX0_9BACL|nr:response regulator transcription factor [Paenibacillus sp. P96]MDP4097132.1 response regulator transcription factor [Paenibacillus sp. P96]
MKIMIIEDEPVIREQLVETLEKWGYEVIALEDFHQVLQAFLTENPHLVLLDINLPAFDGYYWCSRIREVSKAPIMFLSSRTTPMDMVMSMNMGGDDFIAKPFYEEVLIAKIKALLRRTYSYSETSPNIIEHDGVVLNLNDGCIINGARKTELTKNEFKILKNLLQHKESIVSREKLMRSLWEDESFVDDNTLTVNITRIRKKLAEIGKENYITTIKGEGYIIK